MIISLRHKYLFLEHPATACTAIARELVEFYDGEAILFKHASYLHFVDWAGPATDDFFIVGGNRNPMDQAVSGYFKMKTNHHDVFTNPECLIKNGGFVSERRLRAFQFIQENDADFAEFFKRFCRYPFVNPVALSLPHLDHIIRFEHIQEDFSALLARLGLDQIRPIPTVNKTNKPKRDYRSYYVPEIRARAVRVLGPLMSYSGYAFPQEWNAREVSTLDWMAFHAKLKAKKLKSRHFGLRAGRVLPRTHEIVLGDNHTVGESSVASRI